MGKRPLLLGAHAVLGPLEYVSPPPPIPKIPSAFTGVGVYLQVIKRVVVVHSEHLGTHVQKLLSSDMIFAQGCRDTRTVVTGHTLSRHCWASIGAA